MRQRHIIAVTLLFAVSPALIFAQTGTGNLYVYRPTDNAAIISGQVITCSSSCSGSTVITSCNYNFNPLGQSCTGTGYFTGHTDFSSLQGCITQETTTARALSTGEQNIASCDICDNNCCIACTDDVQTTNCGSGYNQCETQCGAPAGTSLAGVTYTCDDRNVSATLQVCDATGTAYFADKCGATGTSCALADNTTFCRTSAYATGCTASNGCNNVPPATNINACAYTGQTYLRDNCNNACVINELNICGAPSFGTGCTGDESCNGAAPGTQALHCNYVGNNYFQDRCDGTCRGWDNTSVCRSAGSLGAGDGCTAASQCNGKAPNTCAGETKCNGDCSYSTCDNGCCDSMKKASYAEGYCSGGCRGNNVPTASAFQAGGTFVPGAQVKLNATLNDADELNEWVNLTFYKDSACTQQLGRDSCQPPCTAHAPVTLGSSPDAYETYYKVNDSRLESPCSSTGQIIKIHNFTLSFDYEDKPMLVNASGTLYVTPTSLPERLIMDNTQISSNSYEVRKGGNLEGSGSLAWNAFSRAWVSNFTPKAVGTYQFKATFTDTYWLTNSITAQMEAADTLTVTLESEGTLLQIPLGKSARVNLNVKNTGNKARTYNLTFVGTTYTTSFNGMDLPGRRWHTLMDVPAQSNSTGLILIAGREVSPYVREFKIYIRNLQTNAESENKTVTYKVVYASGDERKFAPDLDAPAMLLLLGLGILYMRSNLPLACRQKNSKK